MTIFLGTKSTVTVRNDGGGSILPVRGSTQVQIGME